MRSDHDRSGIPRSVLQKQLFFEGPNAGGANPLMQPVTRGRLAWFLERSCVEKLDPQDEHTRPYSTLRRFDSDFVDSPSGGTLTFCRLPGVIGHAQKEIYTCFPNAALISTFC
jgi:hypothetical protein